MEKRVPLLVYFAVLMITSAAAHLASTAASPSPLVWRARKLSGPHASPYIVSHIPKLQLLQHQRMHQLPHQQVVLLVPLSFQPHNRLHPRIGITIIGGSAVGCDMGMPTH